MAHRNKRILATAFLTAALLCLCACGAETPAEPSAAPSDAPLTAPPAPTAVPLPPGAEALRITELMPANKSFLPDDTGAFADWIELTNTGASPASLGGLFLSDDASRPDKLPLPERELAGGESLVIFCGEESFSLSRHGETVLLSTADGQTLHSFSYGETEDDRSVCFSEEGAAQSEFATPGWPNTEQGYEDFLTANDRHGALVINEIVSFNDDYEKQHGKHYDWIELKNVSDAPLELKEYSISDDPSALSACALPERTLRPGELFVLFASGDSKLSAYGHCHVDFKVGLGESVYLWGPGETMSDRVRVPALSAEMSYGRLEDGSGFYYLSKRTPGKPNKEGFRLLSAAPAAELPQGVYDGVGELSLALSSPGTIYYTLDGSMPGSGSAVYSGPIPITKTTVVRARAREDGRGLSPCTTLSYIVNEGHSLPVVSVVCAPRDFKELSANFKNRNAECSAEAVFFDANGVVFDSECGLKLHGASTRAMPKKSFKIIFRDRYGGDITCDPFQNGVESEYHSLLLRGGTVHYLYIVKDQLASLGALQAAEEPLTLDARYCVMYVNGEYWGIYALREAYSKKYAADHTGGDEESAELARARDNVIMSELVRWAKSHPMDVEENYQHMASVLDIDSFTTWIALEAYFDNLDSAGNIRYIRTSGTDWKWRVAFFDLDIAMYDSKIDFSEFLGQKYYYGEIAHALMRNPAFRESLLRSTAQLYHNGLGSEMMLGLIQEIYDELEPEMRRNCKRWNDGYGYWESGMKQLHDRFGDKRTISWIESLQSVTKASDEEIETWFGDLSELYGRQSQ